MQRVAATAAIISFAFAVVAIALVMAYAGTFVADRTAALSDPRYLLYVLTHYPNALFSFATLGFGLVVAVASLATRGGRSLQRPRPLRVLRLVFSPRYLKHRSHVLDALFFLANVKVFVLLFGWLILSTSVISTLGYDTLVSSFGLPARTTLPDWQIAWGGAVALYLAYEFSYYLDHTLSHRIPFLWEFHRVHHEAEVLSPLTTFRVHPVDTIVYYNILAIVSGLSYAALHVCFGLKLGEANVVGAGLILAVFSYLFLQLQHTQLWIPLTGTLGRILISPAHHQIHHSADPAHFDKNMGNCLAVFDWLFGTLHVPARKRERLTFGVTAAAHELPHDPQSAEGALLTPFRRGYGVVVSAVAPQGDGAAPAPTSIPATASR